MHCMSFDNVILAYVKFTQHIRQVDGHKQMKWMKEHGAMIKEGMQYMYVIEPSFDSKLMKYNIKGQG